MAVRPFVIRLLILVICCWPTLAAAQHLTAEFSGSAGASTDDVTAAAAQSRVFGDIRGTRFFVEGAWAGTTERADGRESEAFATAYPYEGPPSVLDAYVEHRFGPGSRFAVVKAGRFRTPFGFSDASDHAYNGFLRAPLIRYEGYWGLTNTLLEHGVNLMAGSGRVQGEVSLARPADIGETYMRGAGTDFIARIQTYGGPFVVGVSHLRSRPYALPWASGDMVFTGIDARWMAGGVGVRGEWLIGQPWNGGHTNGAYVDISVHRPAMGPVTVVGRLEALDYETPDPRFSDVANGIALGARVKLIDALYAQANVTHRPAAPYGQNHTATDIALTYTLRYRR